MIANTIPDRRPIPRPPCRSMPLTGQTAETEEVVVASSHVVPPVVDVTLPVHNEAPELAEHVRKLRNYLVEAFPFSFRITIVDNASVDGTFQIAQDLERSVSEVRAIRVRGKGRGRALRHAWMGSDSPVLAYMDLDLSTDLRALLPLVAPLLSNHSDLAIGTRLARGSRVVRGTKREFISRCYNVLLRLTLGVKASDAQCGFKAIRSDVARAVLPLVEDTEWFFDTELIVLAERLGLRTHEVPVDWVDDPDTRVDILPTAIADLKGVGRMAQAIALRRISFSQVGSQLSRVRNDAETGGGRQLLRFLAVGVLSTVAYAALFVALGSVVEAPVANATALAATAIANTAVNRRFTFGVRDGRTAMRHQLQGLIVFAAGLSLTEGALLALSLGHASASRAVVLPVLLAASLAATLLRFALFRAWVFAPSKAEGQEQPESQTGATR